MALVNLKLCAEALKRKFQPPNSALVVDTNNYSFDSFGNGLELAVALQLGESRFSLDTEIDPQVIDEAVCIPALPLRQVLVVGADTFLKELLAPAINTTLAHYQHSVLLPELDELAGYLWGCVGKKDRDSTGEAIELANVTALSRLTIRLTVDVPAFGYSGCTDHTYVPLKLIFTAAALEYAWGAAIPPDVPWKGY